MRRFPAFVLLFLAPVALSCGESRSVPLPVINDIEIMEATYKDAPQEREVKFTVTQPHWNKILDALVPAKRDYEPAKWQWLGELEIKKKDGGQVYVWLFSIPQGPGAFAIGQTWEQRAYYRGGESAKLKQALQAAHEATRQGP